MCTTGGKRTLCPIRRRTAANGGFLPDGFSEADSNSGRSPIDWGAPDRGLAIFPLLAWRELDRASHIDARRTYVRDKYFIFSYSVDARFKHDDMAGQPANGAKGLRGA